MTELEINQCNFCKEIWNNKNMKVLPFKYKVYLCPDCYKEFEKKYVSFKIPEKHGRLIDADALKETMLHSFHLPQNYADRRGYRERDKEYLTDVINAPTILERTWVEE